MNLVWSPEAIRDLAEVHAYIARDNPVGATLVVERIFSLVEELLPATPHVGRQGRVSGTRELVISQTPFVVPYRIGQAPNPALRNLAIGGATG